MIKIYIIVVLPIIFCGCETLSCSGKNTGRGYSGKGAALDIGPER